MLVTYFKRTAKYGRWTQYPRSSEPVRGIPDFSKAWMYELNYNLKTLNSKRRDKSPDIHPLVLHGGTVFSRISPTSPSPLDSIHIIFVNIESGSCPAPTSKFYNKNICVTPLMPTEKSTFSDAKGTQETHSISHAFPWDTTTLIHAEVSRRVVFPGCCICAPNLVFSLMAKSPNRDASEIHLDHLNF